MKASIPAIPQPDQSAEALDESDSPATEEGSSTSQGLYRLVAQQAFFKGLEPRQLQILADCAMQLHFEPGQPILEEGSSANRFYLILEGKVVIESEVAERGVIPIQMLGAGEDLGWSWLFPPFYTQFSARALVSTSAIFFYGTRLREQCEQDHELGYQLMLRIAEVMTQRLHNTQIRLLECTDPKKAEQWMQMENKT